MTGVVTVISEGNEPSIRSYQSFGAEPAARLVYVPKLRRTIERRIRSSAKRAASENSTGATP